MPRSYRVIVSPRAFAHLDEILTYIGGSSPANAAKTIDRLWEAMKGLDTFPRRFRIVRGKRRPSTAVRSMPVWPYIVYYRIVEAQAVVRVVGVRHGARQRPRRFD